MLGARPSVLVWIWRTSTSPQREPVEAGRFVESDGMTFSMPGALAPDVGPARGASACAARADAPGRERTENGTRPHRLQSGRVARIRSQCLRGEVCTYTVQGALNDPAYSPDDGPCPSQGTATREPRTSLAALHRWRVSIPGTVTALIRHPTPPPDRIRRLAAPAAQHSALSWRSRAYAQGV